MLADRKKNYFLPWACDGGTYPIPPVSARRRHLKLPLSFTVLFYARRKSSRKTAQFGETLRKSTRLDFTLKNTLRNIAKSCAKTR